MLNIHGFMNGRHVQFYIIYNYHNHMDLTVVKTLIFMTKEPSEVYD